MAVAKEPARGSIESLRKELADWENEGGAPEKEAPKPKAKAPARQRAKKEVRPAAPAAEVAKEEEPEEIRPGVVKAGVPYVVPDELRDMPYELSMNHPKPPVDSVVAGNA